MHPPAQSTQLPGQNCLDSRLQAFHPARCEGQSHQRTQAGVLGRLAVQQVVAVESVEVALRGIGRRPAQLVARIAVQGITAEAFVPQDSADVRVTGQHQPVHARIEEDRLILAKLGQQRVGILHES